MDYIKIKGYKSFKNLELKLNKINILIGANGSGKSNFLSFFELLNALYEQKLREYISLNGGTHRFLYKGFKVTDSIFAKIRSGRNRYAFELKEGDGSFVFTQENLGYTSATGYYDDDIDISSFGYEANIKTYQGAARGDYIKSYLSEIKKYHFHDTGKTSPFTQTWNVENDGLILYSQGGNLAPFLFQIRNKYPMVYQRILMAIRSVAPYFSDFYLVPSENATIRLQWMDKYSENIYGPTDFSDGTIRFIALVTLFLQPNPPEVIIIDEPELGLHPVAINKLSGLIKSVASRGTQVIIATQSADLVSDFDAKDIVTVNQVDGETKMERLKTADLSNWLDSYTIGDLWKQNILKGGQPQ